MTHKICDACETVKHCSKHGCIPLTQIIAAESYLSDKGYSLGTPEKYAAAVAQRNQLSGPPPLTYEEMLHELWYLKRRVRQLEQQVSEMSR